MPLDTAIVAPPSTTRSTGLNFPSWAAFYQEVGRGEIPFRPTTDYRPQAAVAADLVLSLPDVIAQSRAGGRQANLISVFADVIRSPSPIDIELTGGLFLIARRIELDSTLRLDLRKATNARVAFAAQETSGPLKVTIVDAVGEREVDLTPSEHIGRMLSVVNGVAIVSDIDHLQASFEWDTPLRRVLTAVLQYGAAAFDSNPVVARAMFQFVARATKGVDTATDLRAQSSALLAALNTTTGSAPYVPYLSRAVYEDQAKAFADAALAYEEQRRIYVAAAGDTGRMRDSAKLMLARYQDTASFNAAMLQQATTNLNNAQLAAIDARNAVELQTHAADLAGISFTYSAKIWAREQAIAAAFEVIGAIAQVVCSVAVMAVGDEAAAGSAAKGVGQAAKAGEALAQAADKGKDILTLAKAMENIGKGLATLKGACETISKLVEAIPKIIEAIEKSGTAADLASVDVPAAGLQSSDAQWEALSVDIEAVLAPAISGGVTGAGDYLAALKKQVIYAKAATAAQEAVAKAGQEVLRLSLQKYMDDAQRDRVDDYVNRLGTDQDAAAALGEIFFARERSMRLWLFLALRGYGDAFNYWALRPSLSQASMVSPVAALRDGLANIRREYGDVLGTFNPPPQLFKLRLAIPDTTSGPYAGVVASLKSGRTASVAIPVDEAVFRNLGRVRLKSIRAWLQGVTASDQKPVTVDIATSGYFEDRLKDTRFVFSAAPVQRAFQYTGAAQDAAGVTLDGVLDDESQYCLFQPTPFTQLTLTVSEGDLSGLTDVVLEFAGSAIRQAVR